jgi:hypothetical protein
LQGSRDRGDARRRGDAMAGVARWRVARPPLSRSRLMSTGVNEPSNNGCKGRTFLGAVPATALPLDQLMLGHLGPRLMPQASPARPPASSSCPRARPAHQACARSSSATAAAWVASCPAPHWTAAWRSSAKSASAGLKLRDPPPLPRQLRPRLRELTAQRGYQRHEHLVRGRTLINGHSRTLPAKIH